MGEQPNTVIESLGVYLPPHAVPTREVLSACRRRIIFPLEMVTGIQSRRMAQGEYAVDLAGRAVEDCLAQSKYLANDIDLLISCNISRYDGPGIFTHEPSTALQLKERFNFNRALAFDISNACAGVFTGILMADCFLKAGSIRRAMVVSGEHITHLTETAQREIRGFMDPRLACLTLGDSGVAMILEAGPDQVTGFLNLEIFTLGQHSQYCIAKASDKSGGAIMLTDVVKLSAVAVTSAAAHAVDVQRRAGWLPEELNHLIMHQTSQRTIEEGMDRVNRLYGKKVCTANNTINNLKDRGNTATTSHFVAFRDHAVLGRIQPGENVIFSVNASGLTIGTSAYICDSLPARLRAHAENGVSHGNGASHGNGTGHGNGAGKRDRRQADDAPLRAELKTGMRIGSIGVLHPQQVVRRATVELSSAAAEACLENFDGDRTGIEVLLYAGVYRTEYVVEPATAALIAGELGMYDDSSPVPRKRTLCFDVLSGAAGFLKALHVAAQMMQSKRAQRVLIVTSEIDCNAGHPEKERVALEPTASALLLEAASEGEGFQSFAFRDFPEHIGAFRSHCDLFVTGGALEVHRDPRWAELYLDCIEAAVHDYLQETGLDRRAIRAVLAPQISPAFLEQLGRRLGFSNDILVKVSPRFKDDLFTSSLPYAFWELQQTDAVRPGELGLCIAVGAGIQVGCAVYRF